MLAVENLNVTLRNGHVEKHVLHNISFSIPKGKVVGIIGESGSGKSVLCTTIMQLFREKRTVTGNLSFNGMSLVELSEKEMRKLRGNEMALIMQNPMAMFNPIVTIGEHFTETIQAHRKITKKQATAHAKEQLKRFQLFDENILKKYPHELSGGMLQRVMIAIAASLNPSLLLADEPTTALDTTTQLEILKELKQLHATTEMSMLIVSHDLGVIANLAEEIIVMRHGVIVEKGPTSHILQHPRHRYSQRLVAARDEHSQLADLIDRFDEEITGELMQCDPGHWVRMEGSA
ncbi:ABC transporter ATP-binding protein [Lysinibacillus sp. KU-BSD001]|uniref:ABC transporter ATP-binding protein n=1 Tax=Lysinibacillus sp. KU-BSD001 TaxID=3141328 RepID=UPI0036E9CFD7